MVAARKQETAEAELLDLELDDLPAELKWREWMNRIEAVMVGVIPQSIFGS